jgi:hypothetical protein
MAEAYKKLYQGQPGVAAANVYTVASGKQAIVKQMKVINVTEASVQFTLYQSGLAAANQITPTITLGPGEFAIDDDPIFLAAADTIGAKASVAASITLTIGGVEVDV